MSTVAIVRRPSPTDVADPRALLREAIKDYESQVLAWYALGRPRDARVARATIARHRAALRTRG
jgi:hypothetical protein